MAFILQATRYVKGQPTPVFWPGESHGQRSLAGYSPRGLKESDMTERLTLLLYQWKYWKSPSYGRIVSSKPQIGTNLLQVVQKKKKKQQIKYLNSRWSHKIWDVMKSGEGSRENAQPKCRQRWTIRNGRRSRGQRGWGPLPDPCSMRCVQWVCPGVWWSNTGCCPPACTAVNQNLDSPVSHISLSSLGPRGDPLQKICMHLFLERASLVAQMVQNLPANAGDTSSIPGSGRSPGEGNGSPLEYACL